MEEDKLMLMDVCKPHVEAECETAGWIHFVNISTTFLTTQQSAKFKKK